jgi:acyl carrier protein
MSIAAQLDESVNQDVWTVVHQVFQDALELDPDEVEFSSKLIEDLEAESIDFLDITFNLEKQFPIKIPRGGIEKAAREGSEGDGLNPDGTLTAEALEALKVAMPEVPPEEFVSGLKPADIPNLFRVGTFYNLVIKLLAENNPA